MVINVLADTRQVLQRMYGPYHYYTTKYSTEEQTYWEHIPQWLEDICCNYTRGHNILDVGPGYGTLACTTARLSPAMVVTMDRLPLITEEIAKLFNICCIQEDVERAQLDLKRGLRYDTVIITEVIEHFNFNPIPTLQGLHSMMNQGANLLLSTPDSESWGRTLLNSYMDLPRFDPALHDFYNPPWIDGHIYQYNESEITSILETTDFSIELMKYSVSPGGRHFNIWAKAR